MLGRVFRPTGVRRQNITWKSVSFKQTWRPVTYRKFSTHEKPSHGSYVIEGPKETAAVVSGSEKAEMEGKFTNMSEKLGTDFGTLKSPVQVPSSAERRVVGCTGSAEDPHEILWHNVEEKPTICLECGQVFVLVRPPNYGAQHDEHHGHGHDHFDLDSEVVKFQQAMSSGKDVESIINNIANNMAHRGSHSHGHGHGEKDAHHHH